MDPAQTDGNDTVFFVSMHFKGQSFDIPVQVGDTVSTIFDFAQEALQFPRENCRLIHRGKQLQPHATIGDEKTGLSAGAKVMLVASSARDVAYVKSSRADPLVKGFVEEERDERSRKRRTMAAAMSAWGTKQDSEYRFNSIKAEFKYHTPTPYDAERLLEKLATDPGIIEIMKARQFKVGILTEMSPVEAQERMAKEGTPNMDLLGYNQNHGDKIVLRLRTDTLKGFRPYHDIMNTLIHELTHNVWGPHDHNFWKLFGELKAQYMRFHRFWSQGGHTADSGVNGQFAGFADEEDDVAAPASGFGQVLGSAASSESGTAVAAAPVGMAERRALVVTALGKRTRALPILRSVCGCGLDHDDIPLCQPVTTDVSHDSNLGFLSPRLTGGASLLDNVSENNGFAASSMQAASEVPARSVHSGGERSVTEATEIDTRVSFELSAGAEMKEDASHLSTEDLGAFGLDETALWVERFSTQLRALHTSDGAVKLLLRLVQNVVHNPGDAKFRSIRAANPKIRSTLLSVGEVAKVLLMLLGFHAATESGETVFVLQDVALDCARLRLGKDLLEQQLLVDPVC